MTAILLFVFELAVVCRLSANLAQVCLHDRSPCACVHLLFVRGICAVSAFSIIIR